MSRSPFLHPFSRPAAPESDRITIAGGAGARLWDDHDREYVDLTAGLWSCTVGHGRFEIADQVASQMAVLEGFHTFDRFTNAPAERFAAFTAAAAPMDDCRVFLTVSGSEAVDVAVKLAGLTFATAGDAARTAVVARVGADDLDEVEDLLAREGDSVAALVVEPLGAGAGVEPHTAAGLARLRAACDAAGALLVLDESVAGFGRLGDWTAAAHFGVAPDLVTFGESASSGYVPIGGVVVGPALLEVLEADPEAVLRFGGPTAGHPVAAVAALENARILLEEDLFARVPEIAASLGGGLVALAADGVLDAVRGVGAMWAADLPAGVDGAAVGDALLDRGVLVRVVGGSTVVVCPPLVVTPDQIAVGLAAIGDAVAAVRAPGGA